MINIINTGIGNFNSIHNMIKRINLTSNMTSSYDEVSKSKFIILPGVGSFDKSIIALRELKLHSAITNAINNNAKLLGICVGMQMMFNNSEEGKEDGLSLIDGKVIKFDSSLNLPIPHMGWNKVQIKKKNNLFSDQKFERFYFAHSYYCSCKNKEDIISTTNYGVNFASSVNKNNIYGFQFHPEKSHEYGKNILNNFFSKC